MELGVLVRALGVGPVDYHSVVGGHIGVAVAGIHQIQIARLIVVVVGDGVKLAQRAVDQGVVLVGHQTIHQQLHIAGVNDLQLAAVDVELGVRTHLSGHAGHVFGNAVLHSGIVGVVVRHAADGEFAAFHRGVILGRRIIHRKDRLHQLLVQVAGIDSHVVLMEQIVQTHRKVVGGHKGSVVVGELEPDGDLFAVHFGGQDAVDVAVIGHAVVAFLVVIPLQMPGTGLLAIVVGEGQVRGQVQRLSQRSANRFLQRLIHLVGQLDVEAGGGQAVIGRADLVTGAVHHAVIAIAAGVDGDVGGGDGDGADRVRHGGTIEILRLSRHAVGVHGVQGRFVVGVQAVVALAAVGVICSIGAGFGLRVGQLNGVGQLDRREVGHRNIDLPHKAFVGLAILTLLVVVQNELIGPIGPIAFGPKAVGAGHIGISIGGINEFFLIQLLPADSQRQRIQAVDKVEIVILTITNHVLHRRSFVQQIVNILLDLVKGNGLAVGKISHEGRSVWICVHL